MNLTEWRSSLDGIEASAAASWKVLHLTVAIGEKADFDALCRIRGLVAHDEIERQIAELATVRFPATSDTARRAEFIGEYTGPRDAQHTIGVWMHYPWSRTVVHVLPRDDYFDVITDRNHDKITRDEQLLLRTQRIGVVGLSVGGEAAVEVAQDHLCGHIVLADYDTLDLSNLNRLGASVADLGVNKSVIVARRIACIDPFIEITLFPGGVTTDSMPRFLDGLDLLLEECDNLPVKYAVREAARARGLNIIYAADERGFLSVEPYGNEAALPIFHGRIAEAPQPRESFATPFAFMQALTEWVGGWDGISERSRHSLTQIGQTRSGYPQLASEARFAAGQLGHVARRLLLGEKLSPRVRQVDLDEMFTTTLDVPTT
jgi:tRNA threonylcarbamoyladenosine dehydratase